MTEFSYTSIPESDRKPAVGLIVLQSDETVESEIQQWLPPTQYDVLVSRVPNSTDVTQETLAAMADHITNSAMLLPHAKNFSAVAYCCTSGTSVIGAGEISNLVKSGCKTKDVTNPLSALVNACKRRGITRLGFLSPYIESVSQHLRDVVKQAGIESPVFGSFNEAEDTKVAWIDHKSIRSAAENLAQQGGIDGLFLSCTNLKTYGLVDKLEEELGLPVLSSNFVLAEELRELAR